MTDKFNINDYRDIKKKNDGSFVVKKNGIPYHITDKDEFYDEFKFISAYAERHSDEISNYVEAIFMTEEEMLAKMNYEEKAAYHRQKRDALLNAELWKVERHEHEKILGLATTLSDDEYMNLLRYIQSLRDLPEQPNFPNVVTYPTL